MSVSKTPKHAETNAFTLYVPPCSWTRCLAMRSHLPASKLVSTSCLALMRRAVSSSPIWMKLALIRLCGEGVKKFRRGESRCFREGSSPAGRANLGGQVTCSGLGGSNFRSSRP